MFVAGIESLPLLKPTAWLGRRYIIQQRAHLHSSRIYTSSDQNSPPLFPFYVLARLTPSASKLGSSSPFTLEQHFIGFAREQAMPGCSQSTEINLLIFHMSPPLLESSTYVAFRFLIPPLGCHEFEAIKADENLSKDFFSRQPVQCCSTSPKFAQTVNTR